MKVFQKKFLPDFWENAFVLKYISRIKDQITIENLKTYLWKENHNNKPGYKKS